MTNKKKKRKTTQRKRKSHKPDKFTRWALGIGIAGLFVIGAAVFYILRSRPNITINHSEYPIIGIDISKHNDKIDFNTLKADSLNFVFIKATEGNNYKDPMFESNYSNAKEIGLKVGAYHFFRFGKDGTVQAYNFLKSVKGKHIDLPLVIDVEEWSNDIWVSKKKAIARLDAMVKCLESNNYKVMIYTNKDGFHKYIENNFTHLPLWLCTFQYPQKITNYNWTFLQYSHWGQVDGIKGDVDLNVFNGDKLEWERWLQAIQ